MSGSAKVSQTVATDELRVPLLTPSVDGSGWSDLQVRAYQEPMVYDGWVDSVMPDIALVQVTRGRMRVEQRCTNGAWKGISAQVGDLFLNPPANGTSKVRWRSLSAEPPQTLHICLSAGLLARVAAELTDRDPAHITLEGRSGFQDPLLMQIGMALWSELKDPSAAGRLYVETAAQMLAVHLLHHYASTSVTISEPAAGLTRRQLRQVTDFVLAYLEEDLSLPALASTAGFSPYHFARLFRQATGESPHQFVLRLRVERAERLLREGDLPLARIALECGFANQGHLTRTFKQALGSTPAVYRRQYTGRARFCQDAHE